MSPKAELVIDNQTRAEIETGMLEKALVSFAKAVALEEDFWVSCVLTDSDTMRKLNKKYRGMDKTTDVLSFPNENTLSVKPGELPFHFLGEIIIDINYISNNNDYTKIMDELLTVFVHGLCHLLHYDHLTFSQKQMMQNLEDKILQEFKAKG